MREFFVDSSKRMKCIRIAEATNATRQNVGQSLKRGLTKIYNALEMDYETPFEIVIRMSQILGCSNPDDFEEFLTTLPKEIRDNFFTYCNGNRTEVLDWIYDRDDRNELMY